MKRIKLFAKISDIEILAGLGYVGPTSSFTAVWHKDYTHPENPVHPVK